MLLGKAIPVLALPVCSLEPLAGHRREPRGRSGFGAERQRCSAPLRDARARTQHREDGVTYGSRKLGSGSNGRSYLLATGIKKRGDAVQGRVKPIFKPTCTDRKAKPCSLSLARCPRRGLPTARCAGKGDSANGSPSKSLCTAAHKLHLNKCFQQIS